jgi:CheY-like chemotaxis protein
MNLAVNAGDAMPNGGTLNIETANYLTKEKENLNTGYPHGEYVMLSVSDTGTGIDDEILKHIFEPFFTTKKLGKGTGLGLATVHGIVAQNGGYIEVESSTFCGTTFRILFPRCAEVLQEVESVGAELLTCNASILLVEDDETLRKMTSKMLERLGFSVTQCDSPHQAIECCKKLESSFDLILTDVVMPKMNGKEMVEQIMKFKKDLKVLYISGYSNEIISQKGLLLEDINFIQKPVSLNDLMKKITEILNI